MSAREGFLVEESARFFWFELLLLCFLTFLIASAPVIAGNGEGISDTSPGSRRIYSDPFSDEGNSTVARGGTTSIYDPLAPVNRVTFAVNDRVYMYVLKPAGEGYKTVTPRSVRQSVSNFFSNLTEPINLVNSLLQGRPSDAHNAFGRFVVNSTFGLGGLFDPAGEHLKQKEHSFDETFACWGISPGFYVVWPLMGSSSLRGTGGLVLESYADPLNYAEQETVITSWTLKTLDRSVRYIPEYEKMKKHSVDPYIALKSAYEAQSRCGSTR